MVRKFQVTAFLIFILPCIFSAKGENRYEFTIDLVNVKNDQVEVSLSCPAFQETTVSYSLPKIVPGTYAIYDFGRFVENFSAKDKDGKPLTFTHENINTWVISNAEKLDHISYKVNDSFDAYDKSNPVFEPAGSNIQQDTNYVLNTFAYVGYFEKYDSLPYTISVKHKADFYGSTPLTDEDNSNTSDRFSENNYHEVADNPLMYCVPDTATVQVGNCTVLLSVYSPNKVVQANYLATVMDTLLQAQGKYLGGTLPVNKYAFIVYLDYKNGISGGNGALEHSYCSVYYMPEFDQQQFALIFRDFAAHEFFHILTPLTIHSRQIQYFDFSHPEMSEHLWLYEGTTEYHAHLVQEKYHLITPQQFLEVMSEKMNSAMFQFNDTLPFTVMSKGCLTQYWEQYFNVYQKGALIGMCLDIKLRALSNGSYGIQDLIRDLGKEYGKEKAFNDEELFPKITALTYPQIGDFLNTFVAGPNPLPFEEVFSMVGVNYEKEKSTTAFSFGHISLGENSVTKRNVITDVSNMNEFGRAVGYRPEDEIISINKTPITADNFASFRASWLATVKQGDPFSVVVLRKNSKGRDKKVTLHATVFPATASEYNLLTFSDHPTPQQLKIRNAWLKP